MVTGEGGMLVTDDKELYEKAKFYNNHGRDPQGSFWIHEVGYKYKMSNLQAALGLAQLERIEEFVNCKRQIFQWYQQGLGDVDGINMNVEKPYAKINYWMTSLTLNKDFGINRDDLMQVLKKEFRVDSRTFYYPISEFKPFTQRYKNPISKKLASIGINLPSGVTLKQEEVKRVTDGIRKILKV